MKNSPHTPSRDPVDPERLLRARLRDTTPEFEARFDHLRRRLALEPRRRWLPRLLDSFPGRGAWIPAAAAAGIMLGAALAWRWTGAPASDQLAPAEQAAYGRMVELDDALRDALLLTDPELLEAVLLMPLDEKG